MSGGPDMPRRNKAAWDALYGSTEARIWGADPLPFVDDPDLGAARYLPPGGRVLDAGTGEGRHLMHLLALTPHVHAVDASRSGLAKMPRAVRSRVATAVADLEMLPYPDATFDLVLCTDVVETLPEPVRVLAEFARVVRPGGHLFCNVPDEDDPIAGEDMDPADGDGYLFQGRYFYRFIDEASASTLLEAAGFTVVSSWVASWNEEAHPNFRAEAHRHTSRVFVARRKDAR